MIDIGAEHHMVAVLDDRGRDSCVAPVRLAKKPRDTHSCSSCWDRPLTFWWRWMRLTITGAIYSSP